MEVHQTRKKPKLDVSELHISCLPVDIIRSIVQKYLTASDEEQFGLVCKEWMTLRDENFWNGSRLGTVFESLVGKLSRRPFRFFGVRTTGTEGTCCKVQFRGDNQIYAMKKARVYPRGEGVPYYMLREIEFLRTAQHPNISSLCGISLRKSELLMFFPYSPRTLHEALNPPSESPDSGTPLPLHITKRILYQILQGVTYCHDRGILHRNLKPKHMLLCEKQNPNSCLFPVGRNWESDVKLCEEIPLKDLETCTVLIADFALVRTNLLPLRRFTPEVVTLWYRAPETLLGGTYFTPVDVWSVGCIMAEMLTGKPFFSGVCEVNQLFEIFSKCGSPTEECWPGYQSLPNVSMEFPRWPSRGLKRYFPTLEPEGLDLLENLLCLNPAKRIHARNALLHPFFKEFHLELEVAREVKTEEELAVGMANPSQLLRYLPNMLWVESQFVSPLTAHPHRQRCCQRIIEINDTFAMSPRTSFLAINLLDRYLSSKMQGSKTYFRVPMLLDLTCLHIASKCEDVSYMGVGDLVDLADNTASDEDEEEEDEESLPFTRDKLSEMLLSLQEDILNRLEFRLQIPTTLDFLYCFSYLLHLDTKETDFRFLCFLSFRTLIAPNFVEFAPSQIAFAILLYGSAACSKPLTLNQMHAINAQFPHTPKQVLVIIQLLRQHEMQVFDTKSKSLAKRFGVNINRPICTQAHRTLTDMVKELGL